MTGGWGVVLYYYGSSSLLDRDGSGWKSVCERETCTPFFFFNYCYMYIFMSMNVHPYVFNLWSSLDFVLVYMCPLETLHPCCGS